MFLQNEQCAISTATSANRFYTSARNLPASLNWLNKKADIDTPSPADFKDRLYTIRFGRSILRVVSN